MSAADRDPALSAAEHPAPSDDSARAEIDVPLPVDAVAAFLRDVERLFRLNPQLAIERWIPADRGFRMAGHNESNDRGFDVGVRVDIADDGHALEFAYDAGLKKSTRVSVEPAPAGTRLAVVETYPRIEDAADPRVAEVDRSLLPWVAAIGRHLQARRRWGRLPGWRWWSEDFLLRMVPRSRRIVRLIVWLSLLELLAFVLVALLWSLAHP